MKKENKALARQKRALAQKTAKRNALLKKCIIIAVLIVLFVAALVYALTDDEKDKDNSSTTTTNTTSSGASSDNDITVDLNDASDEEFDTDTSLTVKDGDKVNIDYVGYMDGKEFDGGNTKGKGTALVIGSKSYIDDFEEQLIGHKVGETVDVLVSFPDPYPNNPDYSGKEAKFVVTINGIYK